MVVLAFRETIVHQDHYRLALAALQALGQAAHKGLGLGMDFGQVIVVALDVQGRAQCAWSVLPLPSLCAAQRCGHHSALVPHPLAALEQLNGHGIDHLVAHHHPVQSAAGHASLVHVLDQKVFNLNPDYFSYTLSKLALERAVRLQAQSLAPTLRVNAIAPGLLYPSGPQTQANFDIAAQVNLLRRPIDPQDVAQAAVFLASTASITGTCIQVDNGQHLVPLARDVLFVVDELLQNKP